MGGGSMGRMGPTSATWCSGRMRSPTVVLATEEVVVESAPLTTTTATLSATTSTAATTTPAVAAATTTASTGTRPCNAATRTTGSWLSQPARQSTTSSRLACKHLTGTTLTATGWEEEISSLRECGSGLVVTPGTSPRGTRGNPTTWTTRTVSLSADRTVTTGWTCSARPETTWAPCITLSVKTEKDKSGLSLEI